MMAPTPVIPIMIGILLVMFWFGVFTSSLFWLFGAVPLTLFCAVWCAANFTGDRLR